jgi:hypothetical protein
MNAHEFRQQVMAQERPELSKTNLALAVDFFVSEHRTNRADLSACLQLAGRLEAAYPSQQPDTTIAATAPIVISPGAVIASETWAEELRPWVERVRQEVFGNTKPPFKTVEEAGQALKGTTQEVLINQAIEEITTATRFSQAAIAAYIVTGIKPFVSSAEIRVQGITCQMPTGGEFARTQATIEINWGDMSFERFKYMHREVRKALGIQKVKGLTDRDQRLLDLVKRLGGEPSQGKSSFWERVRKEWNSAVGSTEYRTWRGLEMKYRRLQKKLNTQLR